MKKIITLSILVFTICAAFNKISTPVTDYRDAYTGYYFCHRSATSFNMGGPPNVTKDTITICVTKDVSDSIVQIAEKGNTYQFKLKNGNLYASPASGRQSGKFFAADSISLTISYGRGSVFYKGKMK